MILFNKNNEKVELYSFNPKVDKINTYKIEEMNNINDSEKVLIATGEDKFEKIYNSDLNYFVSENDCSYDIFNFNGKPSFCKLSPLFNDKNARNVLSSYYIGKFSDKPVVAIDGKQSDDKDLFLLVSDEESNFNGWNFVTKDVIQITKSLYNLQLLEQGKFDEVIGDVSKELEMFDLSDSPIDSINIDEFNKRFGNINTNFSYSNVLDLVNKGRKRVKKIER